MSCKLSGERRGSGRNQPTPYSDNKGRPTMSYPLVCLPLAHEHGHIISAVPEAGGREPGIEITRWNDES